MAIADDFSVSVAGDIRRTGTSAANHTVLAFHRFLQDLADDAQASGDDLVDITSSTPSDRSTDQIITLNSPYNIDDTAARHLYDGSVTQNGGDDQYSGLQVLGPVESGTEVIVIQDDKPLPAWWGTGVNAAGAIVTQMLIKSRNQGADIDGKRVTVQVRELGDQYREFSTTLGLANAVAAVANGSDLNNTTSRTTLEGYTTIATTEGFQLIDIDGDTTDEEYYIEFDRGSQTLNDTYEWSKWQQARALVTDEATETGSDFIVDNATITGQGQEFSARGQAEKLVEMRFFVKIGGGTPTGTLTAELYLSDDAGTAAPTGGVLATSEPVLASLITSSYAEIIFRFNDNVTLTASEDYFCVIRHADGTGTDFFHVRGDATGTDDGNRAEDSGGWTGNAGSDLDFTVKSSPIIYGRAGELHRGITHGPVAYDNEAGGPFTEGEILYWGTEITYDGLSGTFEVGKYVEFQPSGGGTKKNGGKILADTGSVLTVALENITANLLDNDIITGIDHAAAATANINVTIVDQNRGGGEAVLLALDDDGATGNFYFQLISGVAPVDDLEIVGRTSGATADVNTTITSRTISPEFIGASTGTNLIGAYGVGFDTNDVGASDLFFDLTNTPRTPPNNVTFTVTGLVSGEDRVLVGPRAAGTLQKTQWRLNGALSSGTTTSIVVEAQDEASPIATDTPADGSSTNTRLRVQLDTGVFRRQAYSSYTGATFTVPSTDYSGGNSAADENDVFVAYIDVLADATSEAYTAVYDTDRDLFVRVRDGGGTPIKTFEGNATFGSTSSSIAAIRTSDA